MILKGNQRGGGKQLARHLLNVSDNEHVQTFELRGFTADDLEGAFQEAYAVSRATRCKQFLFSLSLNPPQNENVSTEKFAAAIDAAEEKLGLSGQPRAIVFHEKDGRRHAHAVWSRIDTENMRAVPLPFYKRKLMDVSRGLYLEHGWQMPRGLVNPKERDPANYTLAEWQQAKRAGHDPKALKGMFQELWASSDSAKAFGAALRSRGFTLARGDRRGYVAVDYKGEVYAIARYAGIKTKEVRGRLGDPGALPSVEEAKREHASRMTDMLRRHIKSAEERSKRQDLNLTFRRNEIIQRQRNERAQLDKAQQTRLATETRERTSRFSRGFRGLWDRVNGKHAEIKRRNEREAWHVYKRDQAERDKLIFRHIEERGVLHRQIKQARNAQTEQVHELGRDIAKFEQMRKKPAEAMRDEFSRAAKSGERSRTRGRDRGREPDFER